MIKVELNSTKDYEAEFNKILNNFLMEDALELIKRYNASEFKSLNIDKIKDYLLERVENNLTKKIDDGRKASLIIKRIMMGIISTKTITFCDNVKVVEFILKFGSVNFIEDYEFIKNMPMYIIDNVNNKHIKELLKLLITLNNGEVREGMYALIFGAYLSIGYRRCKDLLSYKYGKISYLEFAEIFKNVYIRDILFKKDGNNYEPILNNELINLLFGESYKVKNTPIKNWLDGGDKEDELDREIDKIIEDSNLTKGEKELKIEELENASDKYFQMVSDFFENHFGFAIQNYPVILEEFYKASNKTKLTNKLGIVKLVEIIRVIKSKVNMPPLEIEDEPLRLAHVFDYVGVDSKYVTNIIMAPYRAVELSRKMTHNTKKFPDISISLGNFTLHVFNPVDRRILVSGHQTNCCFVPCGSNDLVGKENSLINYCVESAYGGGLYIVNEKEEVVMFSPLLRNGNVLMIHSIEVNNQSEMLLNIIHVLLKKFAREVIQKAKENDDEIDFVFIGSLHYLNELYVEGKVPENHKFNYFNELDKYYGMTTNLDVPQYILGKSRNASLSDIEYGEVKKDYVYPPLKIRNYLKVDSKDIEDFNELDMLMKEIIYLTSERTKLNDSEELLELIKEKKEKYLALYRSILQKRKDIDIYQEYKRAIECVSSLNTKLDIKIEEEIKEIIYGINWYIVIGSDGNLTYAYAKDGENELNQELKKLNRNKIHR